MPKLWLGFIFASRGAPVVLVDGMTPPYVSLLEGVPIFEITQNYAKLRPLIGHFVVSQNSYLRAAFLLVDSSCSL